MSPYLAVGMLIAFVAWSGFMYYEGASKETVVCGEADAKATVKGEQNVIKAVAQQQDVTQGVEHDYQAKKSAIDSDYLTQLTSVQPSASVHRVPTPGSTACRSDGATSRSFRTKVFKLSAQECDENTEQLYGLQEWVNGQEAVKAPQ